MTAEVSLFLCLKDNYGVLLHDPATGATAAIDAPEAAAVESALKAKGWKLTDILVTHHHADHTDGIPALKEKHKCRVVAPPEVTAGWLHPASSSPQRISGLRTCPASASSAWKNPCVLITITFGCRSTLKTASSAY